jgi:uncharacterized protein (TIGR00251 family)
MPWTPTRNGLRLAVRVQPRGSRNRVVGRHGGAIKVQVNAPPVGGAANEAVLEVVADWLGLSRRKLVIVRGRSARDKVIEVTTEDGKTLGRRIDEALERLVDTRSGRD